MSPLGIRAIASHVPEGRRSNLELAARFQLEEGFVRNKIGIVERSIKDPGQGASDLACRAIDRLMAQGLEAAAVQALVVVTQNPERNIPHVSALVHRHAGLADSCAAFDVSLGCSGYVYGLSILASFMRAHGMTSGVLVTADPYSSIIDEADQGTALLFGDAATATWISDSPAWDLRAFSFGSRGRDWAAIRTQGGKLAMDGRAVFNFAATTVPADIRRLVEGAGSSLDAVDLFVIHQGSRFIVKTIAERLGQPMGKFPVEIENCGNTVSSTIPLILERRLHDESLGTIVLSGFGVGLSWASCICRKVSEG